MRLRTRLALTSLLVALPAAALVTLAVARWQARDLAVLVEAAARSQLNEESRDRCIAQPHWFFTGPQPNRPRTDDPPATPDTVPPRPRPIDQGFELFPYDGEMAGSSPASPRLSEDMRRALRRSIAPVHGTFATADGEGAQVAIWTRWEGTPCALVLGRMRPPPGRARARLICFVALVGAFALVAYLASGETIWRTARLAGRVESSVRDEHLSIVPDPKKDEIGNIGFAYNTAVRAIQLKRADVRDRDDALKRYAESTLHGVAEPLAAATGTLAGMATRAPAEGRATLAPVVRELHRIQSRVRNLEATARLRGKADPPARDAVNLGDVIARAVEQAGAVAGAAEVTIAIDAPSTPVIVTGDAALFESALGALLDNAIQFSRPGGRVRVRLDPRDAGRAFTLTVTDDGVGVSDDELKGLAAIRRFRGDEDRVSEAGVPGLGLAVARETAERAGFAMTLRKPAAGGFEVEWTGGLGGK